MYQSFEATPTQNSSLFNRVNIARGLSAIAAGCIVVYMVLMVQTISLINERKDIRASVRDAQVAISDLEVHYFELAQSIDEKTIADLGFTESVIPVFAYTSPEHPTVALVR